MAGRIVLREGDITQEAVDAIVNAANCELVLGAGVAGAIRSRGGVKIQEECTAHGSISVGGAAITTAGELPARFVIHAAGMSLGGTASEASVREAFRNSLVLAARHGLRSIAAPAIGAGVGGVTLRRVAEILIDEARIHLRGETSLEEIRFVLFGEPAYRVFEMVYDSVQVAEQMQKLRDRAALS